jgi:hypothetical protein
MESSYANYGEGVQQILGVILSFTSDFLAFIIIAAVVAAFAFYFGRNRIMPLLAGIYTAIPLYLAFPYTNLLTTPLVSLTVYIVLVLLGMIAFSGLASFLAEESMGFIRLAILSALTAGLCIAISIYILPVEQLYAFSAPTRALFAGAQAYFFWLVAPLVSVYFLSRR